MFNTEDNETIMALINKRHDGELVIPLYARVGKNIYSLIDIPYIPDCSPSIFKVGFGSSNSLFIKTKFPTEELINFSNVKCFNHFDEDAQCLIQYFVFESSDVDKDDELSNQINTFYDVLLDYTMKSANANKQERIKRILEDESNYI